MADANVYRVPLSCATLYRRELFHSRLPTTDNTTLHGQVVLGEVDQVDGILAHAGRPHEQGVDVLGLDGVALESVLDLVDRVDVRPVVLYPASSRVGVYVGASALEDLGLGQSSLLLACRPLPTRTFSFRRASTLGLDSIQPRNAGALGLLVLLPFIFHSLAPFWMIPSSSP